MTNHEQAVKDVAAAGIVTKDSVFNSGGADPIRAYAVNQRELVLDLVDALKWVASYPYAGGMSFGDTPIVKAVLAKADTGR